MREIFIFSDNIAYFSNAESIREVPGSWQADHEIDASMKPNSDKAGKISSAK